MTEPWPEPSACAAFDEASAELALGLLDPDVADQLLAHAAGCDRCRVELDSLVSTADRITLLAPEAEPPAGFERKAVAAMGGAATSSSRSRRALVLVAAAVVLIAVAGGIAVGRLTDSTTTPPTRVATGVLTDRGGQARGVVTVVRGEHPTLVMSLADVDAGGTYHCSVRTADGHTTEVAAWTVPGSGGGTWKVAISQRLAGATHAVVTEDGGSVVATATLS
jgi:hypothetical protein